MKQLVVLKKHPFIYAALGAFAVILLVVISGERMNGHSSRGLPIHLKDSQPLQRRFQIFGTFGTIELWGQDKATRKAAEDIITRLQSLHNRIDLWNEKSELSRLNEKAFKEPFGCTDEMWKLLRISRTAYRETGGAFDVTIGPLMEMWGFYEKKNKWPQKQRIQRNLEAVGFNHIQLVSKTQNVRFDHPEIYIDFGGLAKGYALDLAVEKAEEYGIDQGIINLGGNIACLAEPPPGKAAYNIGIRNPLKPSELLRKVDVTGCFISSSGNYENYLEIEGKRVGHIVDPRTGYPVEEIAGTSVIAKQGITSDIYSTAVFVEGKSMASRFVETHKDPAAVFVVKKGDDAEKPTVHKYGSEPRNVAR